MIKMGVLRSASILLLVILSLTLFLVTQTSHAIEGTKLIFKSQIFDVETSLPISNVTASFYLTTKEEIFSIRESDLLAVQGVVGDDGSLISTLNLSEVPKEPIRLFVASFSSQPPGVWIVEKVVGDREYSLWGDGDGEGGEGLRWMGLQPDQFLSNVSTYMFPLLPLNTTEGGPTVEVSLYLRRGRLVDLTLVNPFQGDDPWYMKAVPSFMWMAYLGEGNLYFRANRYMFGNFAPIDNNTLVVAPLDEPLEGTAFIARVGGIRSWWGGYNEILGSWTINFSFGIDEGNQINLTPRALRSISKNCKDGLSSLLEDLKVRGFSVSSYDTELDKIEFYYEQAISAFEEHRISEGVVFSRKADDLCNSLTADVQKIPTQALPSSGWIIITLLFFSFSLSCLMTEEKTKALVLLDLLFFPVFILFALTQPYLRLFLSDPVASFHRIDTEFLSAFMQIGLPVIVVALFLAFSKLVRDLMKQSFGVATKNLRRRKMRTILTLVVILIVSASAMCLLSTGYPVQSINARIPLKPLVSNGLVVYKYNFGHTSAAPLSLQRYETNWLAEQEWVDTSSIYGVKIVSISNSTTTIPRYSQFYLAAVNVSFLERFTNAKEILGAQRLTEGGHESVLVGERIAEAYELKVGSEIMIDGKAFTVKGIFNELNAGDGLLDIDGEKLLYQVYDPATRSIGVPPAIYPPYPQTGILAASFLMGSIDDFSFSDLAIYKVSLITGEEFANQTRRIIEQILWTSYEKKEDHVSTYSIYEIKGGEVTCRYLSFETLALVGSWQTQIAPLVICGMIVFVTLHGSVYERRSEIKTLSALGLNPLRIRMMFLIEGLTLGVIGGVLGYVLGFGLIKIGNIALIEGIEENMATGTPLFISMATSVLVSIAGCLLPAKEAVLLAVPSKELLKKYAGIIDVRKNFAILDVPLRVSMQNLISFDSFMRDIVKRYPPTSTPHGMFTMSVEKKETPDSITYEIITCYASERTAHYLIQVSLLKETEPMRIKTLFIPLSGDSLEQIAQWTVDHEHLLPRLAPIIRQDLLTYIERK